VTRNQGLEHHQEQHRLCAHQRWEQTNNTVITTPAVVAAAADNETNAKTRTINNVDQSRRKREHPVTFTIFRSAKH